MTHTLYTSRPRPAPGNPPGAPGAQPKASSPRRFETRQPTGPIVIISDTHMGRPARGDVRARELRPLWQGASQFVVNGDVAEIQMPAFRARAATEVNHLFDYCDADGVALTLLSGNHDPFLTNERHLLLAHGRILVTHGDVFHPAIAPWVPEGREAERMTRRALQRLSEQGVNLSAEHYLRVAQETSHLQYLSEEGRHAHGLRVLLRHPLMLARVLRYWHQAPDLAGRFTAEHFRSAAFVVFGHSHQPGIWHRHGRWVVNTGAFSFPGRPWAVTIEDRRLRVWRVRRRGGAFTLDDHPIRSFTLPDDEPMG